MEEEEEEKKNTIGKCVGAKSVNNQIITFYLFILQNQPSALT